MDIIDDDIYISDSEEERIPETRLKTGINLRELVQMDQPIVFQVQDTILEDTFDKEQADFYQNENLLKNIKLECHGGNDDNDDDDGSNISPFQKMALKMHNLTEDGSVKKKPGGQGNQPGGVPGQKALGRTLETSIRALTRELSSKQRRCSTPAPGNGAGEGPQVPEGASVTVHYNAYLEFNEEPYDSTYMRGKPETFRLNAYQLIQGLEIGIATMKKKEKSQFLISPELAYKELGVPPRIPGNSELLIEVELISFLDDEAANLMDSESAKLQTFKDFYKAAQGNITGGNDAFTNNNIRLAIKKYNTALNILENRCKLSNDEEESKQRKLVVKVCVNLAVCYNKIGSSKQACVKCRNALYHDAKNAKALFNFGRALLMLGDYDEAHRRLTAALKLAPNDTSISEELKLLKEKKNKFQVSEKQMMQRMFSSKPVATKSNEKIETAKVSEHFYETVKKTLDDLLSSQNKVLTLPSGLTAQEEVCLRKEAEKRGMKVIVTSQGGANDITIAKKNDKE
uniref:peptidylprolyl isomerase n=1 Tax=Timema genevievae TaxID=629358 RepID=A0A7R9PMA1_TIMGE|nr:unnamed protein product [Timema genevievae]